ncbi:hypothetical protein [Rhodohalobacter mucosus]|uniref:6-bladed beta-propeller protein n=1 Tax=Rhodohalobacter mucosus TaxID=2079485 RepID=A0A316TWX5_9BACT|nr:hypothetical protein [Rhodohalobacter mucosus]PWN07074.1 hypothetical protein DDZ15_07340 [Rhodohalobacter mucosus]
MRQFHIICVFSMILISCNMGSNKTGTGVNDFSYINGEAIDKELLFEIGPDHELVAGNFANARVLADGRIAILDTRSISLHIVNSDGSLFSSTSLEGRGPGEVENLSSNLGLLDGNRVALYDYLMAKFSLYVYAENLFNYVQDFILEPSMSVDNYYYYSPNQLILHRSTSRMSESQHESVTLFTTDEPLTEKKVLQIPKHQDLSVSTSEGSLNLMFNYSSKYHTRNNICAFRGTIYYNRTDSVGFKVHDLNSGAQLANYNMDVPAILLTREEKESEVDDFIGDTNDLFNSIDRDQLIADMPEIKPLVNKVVCDLPDGIWMALLNEQNESTWTLFSDSGRIKGILDPLPDESVISIHNGHLFTEESNDFGDITFRAYRISLSDI